MSETQTALAPVFAAMSAEMRAMARGSADRGPSPVLHALILFALARIIDRLHAMVLDWQQGRLTPAPCALPPNLPPGRAWAALSKATTYRPHTRTPSRRVPGAHLPAALRLPKPALRPAMPRPGARAPLVRIAERCDVLSHDRAMRAAAATPMPARFQKPVGPATPTRVLNVPNAKYYEIDRQTQA